MAEYAGIKEEEQKRLGEAATMYRNMTGHDLSSVVSGIPVQKPEEDAKAKQARAQKQLDSTAQAQRHLEDADRQARKLRRQAQGGDDVQDNNPGPGQPAMVSDRAREQGVTRKGEEPQRTGQMGR